MILIQTNLLVKDSPISHSIVSTFSTKVLSILYWGSIHITSISYNHYYPFIFLIIIYKIYEYSKRDKGLKTHSKKRQINPTLTKYFKETILGRYIRATISGIPRPCKLDANSIGKYVEVQVGLAMLKELQIIRIRVRVMHSIWSCHEIYATELPTSSGSRETRTKWITENVRP